MLLPSEYPEIGGYRPDPKPLSGLTLRVSQEFRKNGVTVEPGRATLWNSHKFPITIEVQNPITKLVNQSFAVGNRRGGTIGSLTRTEYNCYLIYDNVKRRYDVCFTENVNYSYFGNGPTFWGVSAPSPENIPPIPAGFNFYCFLGVVVVVAGWVEAYSPDNFGAFPRVIQPWSGPINLQASGVGNHEPHYHALRRTFTDTPSRSYDAFSNSRFGNGNFAGCASIPSRTVPANHANLLHNDAFLVPHNATKAFIFGARLQTHEPDFTFPGNGAYYGAVLLKDGRVFLVPYNATQTYVYDPDTDTFQVVTGSFPGGGAYKGGILLSDGRVYMIPWNATVAKIYDPQTNSVTDANGTFPGNGAYWGGTLLPDGRVICCPHNATVGRVYNPSDDTTTTFSSSIFTGNGAFAGIVSLLEAGMSAHRGYALIPYNSTALYTYRPTNSLTSFVQQSTAFPGSGAYVTARMVYPSYILFIPYNATHARLYEFVSNNITVYPEISFTGNASCVGASQNPWVLTVPHLSTIAAHFYTSPSVSNTRNYTLSPYITSS